MDFVSTFPLILAVLFGGHCSVTATAESHKTCFKLCPAGYYKTGDCTDPSDREAKYSCEQCGADTFTDIENFSNNCERCKPCSRNEVIIENCTFNRNVQCDCKEDYYNANPPGKDRNCKTCGTPPVKNSTDTTEHDDYRRKCKPCEGAKCLKDPSCLGKNNCDTDKSVTTLPTSTSPKRPTTANPSVQQVPDHRPSWFVWLVMILAVIFGLLLLWKRFDPRSCPHWTTKKDMNYKTKEPRLNEQHSHQDDASTTLTINVCEETPVRALSQSPSTPEHPAPVSVLLSNAEHRADRHEEQSKDWPAIVLYAIIKEVPLRRWKEFLRLLSVADEQLERVELEAGLGLGSMERQYLMLRLWSQRSSASLDDVFSALHYMDLSRCAQLLKENLENLQWRVESNPGFTA